ncbi:hypothetical protein DL96DRAFT_14962 [Flagelloscypha sp. PMI_526]|nr:hypothetical protein DL96DRAFT_14962 [Flagelloscypha sp. PMI_526]
MHSTIVAATRASARRTVYARSFHASTPYRKTVTEKVKDAAHDVNLKVGKGLSSAIGAGQEAAESASDTLGTKKTESKQKINEVTAEGKKKAEQATEGAKKAKDDFAGEVKK